MFEKLAGKINRKLQASDEEIVFKNYNEAEEEAKAAKNESSNQGVNVSVDGADKDGGIKFKVVHPSSFDEVSKIADYLIEGCTVVLNTDLLDRSVCIRMLDFLNGVTYTTEGYINAVAQSTYIITPSDVDVSDEGYEEDVED